MYWKIASSFFNSRGRDAEHAATTIITAVGHQDVAVWIESGKIAKGLDSDDDAGDEVVLMNCIMAKYLQ